MFIQFLLALGIAFSFFMVGRAWTIYHIVRSPASLLYLIAEKHPNIVVRVVDRNDSKED